MGVLSLSCVSPRAQGAEASGGTPNAPSPPPQAAVAHSLACWPGLHPSLWPLSVSDHPAAWAAAAKGAAKKGLICSAFHQQLGGLPRPTGWVPGRLPPSVGRRRDHRAALPSAFLPRECECVSDSCRLPEPTAAPILPPSPRRGGGGCREGSAQGTGLSSPLAAPRLWREPRAKRGTRKTLLLGDRGGAPGWIQRWRAGRVPGGQDSMGTARPRESASVPVSSSAPALHINSSPPMTGRPQFLFPERASVAFDLS